MPAGQVVALNAPRSLPQEEFERLWRIEMSKQSMPFFVQYYLRTNEGKEFEFADFHVEWMDLLQGDDERVMILGPAAHGKTQTVAINYPLWLMCCFPGVRIKMGCKNTDDAVTRLIAIKSEMETNERLINDFGEFKSEHWREKELFTQQRLRSDIRDKEPSIRVFGSETSIYGARATHLILDDFVTEVNSGRQVKDTTRTKLATNYNSGVRKLGYPNQKLWIRWVNTMVDQRDLLHEIAAINGRVPDDDRVTWKSTKGYRVWRRPALDEKAETVLWPAAHSVESLQAEKAEIGVIDFGKRMQNRVMDPSMMDFQRDWFYGNPNADPPLPGCLDLQRTLNQMPVYANGNWAKVGGYDPNPGVSESSKFCGYAELAFNPRGSDPREYVITDIWRDRLRLPEQEAFCVERATIRGLSLLHIEDNAANQWLLQLPRLVNAVASGHRIEGFNTNEKNKYDPETGVPAMAGIIKAGLLRFPYGDSYSRQMSDLLINEFLSYPQGVTSDILMSVWFAILAAKKVGRRYGLRVYEGGIAGTSFGGMTRGLTAEQADRFFPTMSPDGTMPEFGSVSMDQRARVG